MRVLFRAVLLPESLLGLGFQLLVNLPRSRVGSESPAEKQNVRLRGVDGIMLPPATLLHAHATPLRLCQQPLFVQRLRELLGENHMPGSVQQRARDGCSGKQAEAGGVSVGARTGKWHGNVAVKSRAIQQIASRMNGV